MATCVLNEPLLRGLGAAHYQEWDSLTLVAIRAQALEFELARGQALAPVPAGPAVAGGVVIAL